MKKLSANSLKRKLKEGWEVESEDSKKGLVESRIKLESMRSTKSKQFISIKSVKDLVSESIKGPLEKTINLFSNKLDSVDNNLKEQKGDIDIINSKISELIEKKTEVNSIKVESKQKKKKYKFTVSRDYRGFIDNVVAEEV